MPKCCLAAWSSGQKMRAWALDRWLGGFEGGAKQKGIEKAPFAPCGSVFFEGALFSFV